MPHTGRRCLQQLARMSWSSSRRELSSRVAVELKQALDQGYELAIASRMIAGRNEEDGRLFRPRKWGVKILAMAACAIWRREGGMLWDVLHGVKGFSKQAFLMMNPSRSGVFPLTWKWQSVPTDFG